MFKLKLSDVDLLKGSIPIIAEIVDEGIFKIDKDGMSLLTPDRTMVSVVNFKILSSAFDSYKVDEPAALGLNMTNFVNVLKRVKSTDKLIMESLKEGNKLRITVEGHGKRSFEIPLIDIKEEKPPIDQLNFAGRVEIQSSILEDGVSDADVIGDSVVLEASPELFKIYSRGDVFSAELELKKSDSGVLKLETHENIRARYPLEYLKKMIKAGKLANQAVIEFGTDYPMRLGFKSIDKVHLSFILAPRVEE